jgi:hypothetical protein
MAGPEGALKDQMKNSCNGFDTRVKLDYSTYPSTPSKYLLTIFIAVRNYKDNVNAYPEHKISLTDPDLPYQSNLTGFKEFKFSTPTGASLQLTEAFHTYHRMAGTLSPPIHLAVDFDLTHHLWRITYLIPSDPTSNTPTILPNTTFTPYKNGTWTTTTTSSPHVFIPELNLHIPNMHYFTQNCVYQGFMKVYSTTWNTELETKAQGDREWSDKNEKEVVMRTAAFGYSPSGLEVCARRENYIVENGGEEMRGLGEDVVVPLGLMAVLRLQMESEGKLKGGCSWLN